MSNDTYCVLCRWNEYLPSVGGATGAITQVKQFTFLPTWEAVVTTIVLTIIGGVLGYLVKLGLDLLLCKFKRKHNLK